MKNKKIYLILSLALVVAFSCGCNKTSNSNEDLDVEETVAIETKIEEETTETTDEPVATPTRSPSGNIHSATSTPEPTATPTPDPYALVYEGDGTINPLPEMSFQEMAMDSNSTQETELNRYLNDYLVPNLGINTEDRFYRNEMYTFSYDGLESQYNNCMGTPDHITDGEGIFGYYIMDFDKDNNLDMVVLGLSKGTVNSNVVSYYYRPYMLLCSISDNKVFVSDILNYQIEGSDEYQMNYTTPLAYRTEPAFFTSSDTSSLYFLTRIVDTGSEILLQGYSQKLEAFIGDGQYNCAFEMRIRDGRFQYITYARCNGWGSADQTYTIYSYNNGVIDMNNTETCLEITPYLERLNWGLWGSTRIVWSTVNRGFAYHYGERSQIDEHSAVTMIYDIVNH